MSGLETAIRNALERSERSNAEIRARIYQSARQALENGLKKQEIEDPEVIARQRHRLEAVIHAIETEERAALKARAATPVVSLAEVKSKADAAAQVAAGPAATVRQEPSLQPEARPAGDGGLGALGALRPERDGPTPPVNGGGKSAEAARSGTAAPDLGVTDKRPRKRRRGRLLSFVMVVATLAAAVGAGVWWVQTNDLLKSPAERDTNVANPPAVVESEDFPGAAGLPTLGAQEGFSDDWIEIFTPANAAAVRPGTRATAEPFDDDGGERIRLASATGSKEGEVAIDIPADVLAQLSGKSSTLALSVRALPGKTTEFSVECDFGALGACGRHRFTAHDERVDMLFKISFEDRAPGSSGKLLINSDVSGDGNSLDLYAIRVLPGQ
ncbi:MULTISPECIES: biotin transporter BioY [Sinorhizobium]|uniref:biotin transporter BioY n=1 Tax=Sinorhizobium TaxID=28105 RepID=UPI000BAC8829|nr:MULTISPECIES: biotin transporter BioY [Sinorhizobium]ASY55088.1 putative regulatory protein BirS [Sinorhizobium sp. CCBAU 05631]PDT53926.1 biotin transporter BioY [Sinorhizobium sp. NG07B]POH30984.1 biotin transporter BioY [Sinorhizobium americanum]